VRNESNQSVVIDGITFTEGQLVIVRDISYDHLVTIKSIFDTFITFEELGFDYNTASNHYVNSLIPYDNKYKTNRLVSNDNLPLQDHKDNWDFDKYADEVFETVDLAEVAEKVWGK